MKNFLLNVCITFDFCILNSVCKGDLQGCFTYISETECIVNDYFILSSDLYTLIHSTSDHMPLTIRVRFLKENICNAEGCYQEQIIEKFVLIS